MSEEERSVNERTDADLVVVWYRFGGNAFWHPEFVNNDETPVQCAARLRTRFKNIETHAKYYTEVATNDQRKKLDEAKRLLAEVEQEMGRSIETNLATMLPGQTPHMLMFASMELGQVMAAKKALEAL